MKPSFGWHPERDAGYLKVKGQGFSDEFRVQEPGRRVVLRPQKVCEEPHAGGDRLVWELHVGSPFVHVE